jgi:NADH:ubiquinone oxidoreductase subunit 5 (subunit L)/multisubunit Na+/H+ antiporter MnhA subunit
VTEYIWLIPALPLLAAAGIGASYVSGHNRGEKGEAFTSGLATGAAALALLLVLVLDGYTLLQGAPGQIDYGTWLRSGEYRIRVSFTLDALGLAMTTLVALLALLTTRFSVNYLHREAGYQRFFMVLCLFTAAMLLIVMAGNAVLAFIGWELAGVSSYLLIAYAFDRRTAADNATRAFVTNRIGDAGFLIAIALALFWLGSVEWPSILDGSGELDRLRIGLIAASFLLAALVKSAQVPFAPWITRALEGPTPSSAVFYGALMVHAGVYLVIRLEPLFVQIPVLMMALVLFGAATAIYGLLAGLVQTDVKSGLIFATLGQVGLMFLACGLGWFTFAAWHLAAHAAWRAYQFLSAPGLMHVMGDRPTRPVLRWLARRQWLYTAGLRRFWLDSLADWLLVRPTQALAQDAQSFDYQVVNRLVGLPGSASAVSSLAQWEEIKSTQAGRVSGDSGDIGRGRGVVGRLMEAVAAALHWFEEHLVLKGGDEGIFYLVQRLGHGLIKIETLLSEPRYLILLIVITFVVIL